MSFVVREITRRATGGEIVRPIRHETAELVVGRSPDCAIQLADLAVLPHHAKITRAGPDQLVVEVTGGAPIEINKRFVNRAEMNPAEGARIVIGSHQLTISREAESGDVVVTVERTAPVSDAAQAEDEARIFSLGGTMPGKRRMAWGTATLVLALFLIWPVMAFLTAKEGEARKIHPDEMWLSGTLSAAHAELKNDCQSCHTKAFVAVRDDACLSCHVNLKDHASPQRLLAAHPDVGLQAKLRSAVADAFNLQQWGCTGCHKEHEGPVSMPLTAQSFCSDCHRNLSTELPDTKLLDASDFADDHPEFRPEVVTATSWTGSTIQRVSLDAKPREGSNLKFPHKLHLSVTNGVAQMARQTGIVDGASGLDCANCHMPDETGVRFRPIEMERDCGTCHSLDFAREGGTLRTLRHGSPEQVVAELRDFYRSGGSGFAASMTVRQRPGAFMQGASTLRGGPSVDDRIRAVFSEGGACFDCHIIEAPSNRRSLDFKIKPVSLADRFMARAWFDHRDHDTKLTSCGTCHKATASDQAADLLLPGIAVCRECHVGAHPQDGKVTSECSSCHTYHVAPGAPRVLKSVGADRPTGGTVVEYKPASGRGTSAR
jgi:pSer/pThr/pTyr-binding forkhead associated (FHA) protein